MSWLAEFGAAALYGLTWILVMILAFVGLILLVGGNPFGLVPLGIIAAIWGGRKYYRKLRPSRQTIAN